MCRRTGSRERRSGVVGALVVVVVLSWGWASMGRACRLRDGGWFGGSMLGLSAGARRGGGGYPWRILTFFIRSSFPRDAAHIRRVQASASRSCGLTLFHVRRRVVLPFDAFLAYHPDINKTTQRPTRPASPALRHRDQRSSHDITTSNVSPGKKRQALLQPRTFPGHDWMRSTASRSYCASYELFLHMALFNICSPFTSHRAACVVVCMGRLLKLILNKAGG